MFGSGVTRPTSAYACKEAQRYMCENIECMHENPGMIFKPATNALIFLTKFVKLHVMMNG